MRRWLFALSIGTLAANPSDPAVAAGEAAFSSQGSTLQVTTSERAIIHWRDFSIQHGETTRFVQPGKMSAVLNRVTGKDVSSLMGTLKGNGRVYLVNPNGVIVGANGIVHTAGFFASTLDVGNDAFLSGQDLLFEGDSKAAIVNYGTIRAWNGNVALLGYKIDNFGSIETLQGTTSLAAGQEILLKAENDEVAFIRPKLGGELTQAGKVEAIKAELLADGDPYLLAINHLGKTESVTVAHRDGRVMLIAKGGNIVVEGEVCAPSGTIEIEAQNIHLAETSLIDVSGTEGSGGRAHLIAEGTMGFYGKAIAEGSSQGGDGGFIEVSGHEACLFKGKVSTIAPQGNVGMLVIDPGDVTIGNFGGAGTSSPAFVPPTYNPAVAPGNLDVVDLVAGLAGTSVTILTTAGGFGLGDITIAFPFTWATAFSLILSPSRDLIVNELASCTGTGGITVTANNLNVLAGASPAGLETASGAIDITCFPGDIVITGGTAAGASATIRSDSGTIDIHDTFDMTLTGGTMDGTFAEISSRLADVTCDVVRHNLVLQGGTAAASTNAYAQIGKGAITAGLASVASNILFSELRELVTITGGDADGAYAQIGHAPSPGTVDIDVSGNVTLLRNFNLLTDLELQGGTATRTTAIVGHGNEFSIFVRDCYGNISVEAAAGCNLNGGSADLSHAIIGFHSPAVGAMASLTSIASAVAANNSIDVQTLVDVNLTAGTGSNAVIGYYNAAVTAAFPRDVEINGAFNRINVNMPIPWILTLQAGNTNGISAGAAVIGTFASASATNNTQSNIDITTTALNVHGPGPGDDGAALIVNNDHLAPITTGTDDVRITLTGVATNIEMLGGTGATTGLAAIYGSNDMIMNFNGNLGVNRGFPIATLQEGAAKVIGGNNVMINPVTIGTDVFLYGGTNPAAEALIQCVNGPVLFGISYVFPANDKLIIGEPTGLSNAPSRVLAESGASIFSFFGDVTLTGGTGGAVVPPPTAEIRSNTGSLDFNIDNLILKGGSSTLAYAEISSVGGDMKFEAFSAALTGGTADRAYAQIGKGFLSGPTPTIASNINFVVLTVTLDITGGSGPGAYAQIGHAPHGGAAPTDITAGDVILPAFGIFGVALMGGSNTNATAAIGHGNELSTQLRDCVGTIYVNSDRTTRLTAGTVPQTHAVIGFQNPTAGSLVPFTVTSPSVFVDSLAVFLTATNGSNAVVGYYNGSTPSVVDVSIANVRVFAEFGSLLDLQAGNNGGTGAGTAAIGTVAPAASTVQSTVTVDAGDVNLFGPIGGDDGSSVIFGFGSFVHVNATDSIFMGENSIMANGGTGPLLALAGVDIMMTQNAASFTATGDLTMVVDNLFPAPPGIGPGRFIKEAAATIASLSGRVRIFTARREQNQIAGSINGVVFVPGPLYFDSPTEHWFTYFFNSFGGVPFTIFYKDPTAVPPGTFAAIMAAFSEMNYDLSTYDDLIAFPHWIDTKYDCQAYQKQKRLEESLCSYDVLRDTRHHMFRRVYRNYHQKKIDTLK